MFNDTDYLERDALLAGPLSTVRKHLKRSTETEIVGAKPVEFVKTNAAGQPEIRPYEKWRWAKFPKEHMTDEILKAVGVIAEAVAQYLDKPGDPYNANGFYRACWYSKTQAELTKTINTWVERLREAGAPL